MAQSLSQIYVHIIFHVREHAIKREHLDALWRYVAGIARGMKSYVVTVGGETDHVHILCTLPRDITISDFMEQIKRSSSKWLKVEYNAYSTFSWQRGYGIFSVSQSKCDIVKDYIDNQFEHHKHVSFKKEYIEWLKMYNIQYDENYLWRD